MKKKHKNNITSKEFNNISTSKDLRNIISQKDINISKIRRNLTYEKELEKLQIELVKLQQWIQNKKKSVAIIFEGRDAAGKGGTIRRFTEYLNPRSIKLVALDKPTEKEKGQWYFSRYIKKLPYPGEIAFFDRSWYNRAVVEPVMRFCDDKQYRQFISQVNGFENMLYEDGLTIIKFWLSISKDEQKKRFDNRKMNALKRWKFSNVDKKGQIYWDKYTEYKDKMFKQTHTPKIPWLIVSTNKKKIARLEAIRYVLSLFDYDGKKEKIVYDPNIILKYKD